MATTVEKHTCKKCKSTYFSINGVKSSCPFHYETNSIFNHNYSVDEERELSKLRQEYVGKTISTVDGQIIVLEVLDLKNIEFILMPSHRIFVAPFSYIAELIENI